MDKIGWDIDLGPSPKPFTVTFAPCGSRKPQEQPDGRPKLPKVESRLQEVV